MRPESAPGPARVLKDRVRSVFLHLPKALTGDMEAIHQMRVAGRRLRIALPLLARKPRGRRVKRALTALRDLTRIAGGSRDLDVSGGLFADYVRKAGAGGPVEAVLRRHLRDARGRSRGRMVEALLDLEIARLRRDLRAILGRGAGDIFTVARRLARFRDSEGEALSGELLALGDRFDPESLHHLRIRSRRLRYTAELGQTLRGQPKEAAALFKRLQESLGAIHDRCVLAAWLGSQAASADHRGHSVLVNAARIVEAAMLESGRRCHQSFLESDPGSMMRDALAAMGHKEPVPRPPADPETGLAAAALRRLEPEG